MITKPADRSAEKALEGAPQTHPPARKGAPGLPAAPEGDATGGRRSYGWVGWLFVFGLAAAGWHFRAAWLPFVTPNKASNAPVKGGARVIPVRTAVVERRDMDLYLNGLGTVTAFNTVTLRSRVDGQLIRVAFTEGQMVQEGDLLAEIDTRPFDAQLKQAEGQLAKDEASLKLAKQTLIRVQDLLKTKSIAPQQVDEQVAQVEQLEGTIDTDEALVANAQLQLTYCRIVSPITGRIGLRLVDQGNIVHANDPTGMAVITQLQPISLVFTVPQDEIPRVQKPMQEGKRLSVDAYDRNFRTRLATGTLAAIDNQVDATTGTVRLKAMFENKDAMLFPNQFVNARLHVETKLNAVIVPAAAVQRGPNTTFVYVVKSDDTVELRNVVTGPTEEAETAIETGLAPGETVVTDGIDKLQQGTKVTTREKEQTGTEPAKDERQAKTEGDGRAAKEGADKKGT